MLGGGSRRRDPSGRYFTLLGYLSEFRLRVSSVGLLETRESNPLNVQSTFKLGLSLVPPQRAGQLLAFTRYSFTSSRLCTNQPCCYSSRPPALPTPLQYYCTTIGQFKTPLRPALCMSYTIQYGQLKYGVKPSQPQAHQYCAGRYFS